jgi:para-aminobenzoate synthetase component 1
MDKRADFGLNAGMSLRSTAFISGFRLPCPFESLFPAVARQHLPFILDSSQADGRLGRWSFIGFDPTMMVTAQGRRTVVRTAASRRCVVGSPFRALRSLLTDIALDRVEDGPPFIGGAVGYLAYDLKQHFERLPDSVNHDIPLPEMALGFYPSVLAYEHAAGRCLVSTCDWLHRSARGRAEFADAWAARWRILAEDALREEDTRNFGSRVPPSSAADEVGRLGVRSSNTPKPARQGRTALKVAPESTSRHGRMTRTFTRPAYLGAARRALDYIAAGDIFQVNLSQRFSVPFRRDPFALFQRLRAVNPAPFGAYLSYPFGAVVSASPERFLRMVGRHVETRPIKGTRRRTGDETRDAAARQDLLASPKDNAELTMIVDLERNDLGRVCDYGSVRVTEPRVLETYPSVYHLVATVEGDLHPRYGVADLLRSTFPGGSITGAPKVRAMQIIDELEPTARSVYTGALGYFGADGALDLSIVIRTILVAGGLAHVQVGGGIVADSDPEAEFQETLDKGRALFAALGLAAEDEGNR